MEKLMDIIGMSTEKAKLFLRKNGYVMRPVIEDGQELIGTCDFDTQRVNVEVEKNKVKSIVDIG